MIRQPQACAPPFWFVMSMAVFSDHRRTPDEEQVRQAIASVAHAAEAGDTIDVVEPLTGDFDGDAADLDKRALNTSALDKRAPASMMRLAALRGDPVGVTAGPITIEYRGDRMIATLTVILSSGGCVLPNHMGVYQVESVWRKDDGQWRRCMANWKRPVH